MTNFNDKPEVNFIYSGYGRHINYSLEDFEADYLPRMLSVFAEYLRACGFVYVDVRPVEGGWLFSKDYDSINDDDTWSRPEFNSELYGLDDDDDDQSEINQAAEDYWDTAVDQAVTDSETIEAGDTVFYHGRGAGETTLNDHEQPQGHGGRTGVSLVNMKGRVVMVTSSPVGTRVLVKWNNWFDGHNGMGDDPNAIMSDKSYWWSNIDNVSKSN